MNKKCLFFRLIKSMIVIVIGISFFLTSLAWTKKHQAWDKTFPKSNKADHRKVSYQNRYGITISADMYLPKNIDKSRKYPAIVVGTPYGGVK